MRAINPFFFFFLSSFALAQSFFAPRGLGEATNLCDARLVALGSPYAFSPQNPAQGLRLRTPTFYATGIYEVVYGTEGELARGLTDLRPTGLGAGFPLPVNFGLGVGVCERFNQDFDLYSPVVEQELKYQHHTVGQGGIYRVSFSLWKGLFDKLGLGVDYGWMFGGSTEYWMLNPVGGGPLIKDTVETVYSGGGFRAGGRLEAGIFGFGGFYETGADFDLSGRVSSPAGESCYSRQLTLPGSYGLGVRFQPFSRIDLFFDYYSLPYEEAEIGGHRGNRYALGLEWSITPKIPLRLGISSQEWYVRTAGGEVIWEDALSLGSSIPIKGWGGFDYSLEVLHRQGGDLSEWGMRLVTTLCFEEEWRLRERRWGW
jgi:hypothetical protein